MRRILFASFVVSMLFAWLVLTPAAADALLTLKAEINPDPVGPGELIDVQVTLASTSATGNLALRLVWPQALDPTPVVTGGGSCPGPCDPGDLLVWNLGPLGAGDSRTVGFTETVSSVVASGMLMPLEFELLEDGSSVATLERTIGVQADSPLQLAVDPLSDPVASGGTLVYEIAYGNTSSADAENAELVLPLPTGTLFTSATGGGLLLGNTVVWNLDTVAAQDGGRERVTLAVQPVADGTLLAVEAATFSADLDSQPQQSRAMAVSRVDNVPLLLAVEVNPDPVAPGELLDVQISVASSIFVNNVGLRLRWPEHIDGPTITGGGSCPGPCDPGEFLVWNLGTVGPVFPTLAVGFNGSVSPPTGNGTLIPLEVEILQGGFSVRNLRYSVRVQADSPLELRIDHQPDPVSSNSSLVYELTYGNAGASSAEGVRLSLPLPAETEFQAASGGGILSGNTVSWNLGSLPPGSGGRMRVEVQTSANPFPLAVDAAELRASVDSRPRQSRAMVVHTLELPTVGLMVEVDNPVLPEEDLEVHPIRLINVGSTGVNVQLRLIWPDHLGSSPVIVGGGSCPGSCDPGEYLTWNHALPGGTSVTLGFAERVDARAAHGTLIQLEMELFSLGFLSRNFSQTVLVHPFTDNDQDSEADVLDEDDDNDGMPDWWEALHGLDPFNPADANQDPDMDGVTNLHEYQAGTNPNVVELIFRDRFESGNVSGWSAVVP